MFSVFQPSRQPLPSTIPSPAQLPSIALTPTPIGTPAASPTPSVNQSPVCTGLSVDRAPSGNPPFSIAFTANGNDPDGTITKVSFNFGDGPIQDVPQSSASISTQVSHTYNNAGTYQATVTLTDNRSGVSSATSVCSKTIIVSAASAGGGAGGGGVAKPKPTLPPTGNSATTIGIVAGVILTIIGGVVLIAL